METKQWVVEVSTDSTGNWYGNGLRFDTEAEALTYGRDLMSRWTMVRQFRAREEAQ